MPQNAQVEAAPSAAPQPAVFQVELPSQNQAGPLRPLTERELDAIRDRRNDISRQLTSAVDRRNELAGELEDAPPGTEQGVLARIQLLDARVLQIERDMEMTGQQLRTGMTVDNGVALVAPVERFGGMSEETVAILGTSFSVFFLLPIAIGFMRLMWRRGKRAASVQQSPEQAARLQRLEEAVDAVALEIERVGESQRYQAKVLAEANLMPALVAGRQAAEPVRLPEFEETRARSPDR
ncbi:MAG TPA: hypothetical protein VF981_04865 [Gemmatimonadaceae bacterium]